ncbi:hypothetical protein [Corallococcus exiguus]|uniref:hypothetical protein n=1 Tax=Corallococcus exiguus TaxID=83462 RepID=UPI001470C759|nr:hypothetical protein [Corallococcus exiguus]NNB90045.1 hypothetical protein [Corallococcus exiguus]
MKNVFIILSGGPSVYNSRDPKRHDQAWHNFITAPLARSKGAALHDPKTEDVHWLVYEPAYKERWTSDSANQRSAPTQYQHTLDIKMKHKCLDYLDLARKRATERGWKYIGIAGAKGFWDYINKFKSTKISRLWFYGHASNDLWLSLNHRANDHVAIEPDSNAILNIGDIDKIAARSFIPQKTARHPHKFFGCNTKAFAEQWASALSVVAEGSSGSVDFGGVTDTSGKVTLSGGAQWYQCSKGKPSQSLLSKAGAQVS